MPEPDKPPAEWAVRIYAAIMRLTPEAIMHSYPRNDETRFVTHTLESEVRRLVEPLVQRERERGHMEWCATFKERGVDCDCDHDELMNMWEIQ